MKIIYLIPPSEWKNIWGERDDTSKRSFQFLLPLHIANNATSQDLKCKGSRYEEALILNKNIHKSFTLPAIERYSWVMYWAIGYKTLSQKSQKYFEDYVCILSGMYGIVFPRDLIGNYKLPIETKWLLNFWGDDITQSLNSMKVDMIVDLLPNSYKKMINWKKIEAKILTVEFYQKKDRELKKISHGVKKIKWEYIRNICENWSMKDIEKYTEKENILQVIHKFPA